TAGPAAAHARLEEFVRGKLARYSDARNDVDDCAASGLSPYLHFGHISTHQILSALSSYTDSNVAAFLDQLVTWRELGFNICANNPAYDKYETLPEWARKTLA